MQLGAFALARGLLRGDGHASVDGGWDSGGVGSRCRTPAASGATILPRARVVGSGVNTSAIEGQAHWEVLSARRLLHDVRRA